MEYAARSIQWAGRDGSIHLCFAWKGRKRNARWIGICGLRQSEGRDGERACGGCEYVAMGVLQIRIMVSLVVRYAVGAVDKVSAVEIVGP